MNLNKYIKQTEEEFDDKFTMGYEREYLQNFKSGTKPEIIKAFIKTRIERGVELTRQEAIDVVRECSFDESGKGDLVADATEVIKKLEEMGED